MGDRSFKVKIKAKDGWLTSEYWPLGENVIGIVDVVVPEEHLEDPMATYTMRRQGEKYLFDELIEIVIEPVI